MNLNSFYFFLISLALFLVFANIAIFTDPSRSSLAVAVRYERLAGQFAPSSMQAQRYRAMAQASREGRTTYSFMTTHTPAAMGGGK